MRQHDLMLMSLFYAWQQSHPDAIRIYTLNYKPMRRWDI